MLSWYGRKSRDEEILFAPSNFYLYTYKLTTAYSIDPNELSEIDGSLRRISNEGGLENTDWRVEEVDIPDKQLKKFRELCFSKAGNDLIFRSIMRMFGYVLQKLDYVSIDAGKPL